MYTQSPLTDAHWVDSSCPLLILPCFNFVPSRRGLKQATVLCSITWAVWILCYTAIIEEACFLPLPLPIPIPIHFSNPYLTPSFSSSLPSKFLWWSLLYCHRIWFLPLNYCYLLSLSCHLTTHPEPTSGCSRWVQSPTELRQSINIM